MSGKKTPKQGGFCAQNPCKFIKYANQLNKFYSRFDTHNLKKELASALERTK